jgi:hypothetical protein
MHALQSSCSLKGCGQSLRPVSAAAAADAADALQKTLTARLHLLPMPIANIHASLAVTHFNGSALASS